MFVDHLKSLDAKQKHLASTHLQVHFHATFWPTLLHFVDIFVWVKSGPEPSHEPPLVDRN